MKVFSVILALYITALVVKPCGLSQDRCCSHATEHSDKTPDDERDPKRCSPFCNCPCAEAIEVVSYEHDILFTALVSNTDVQRFFSGSMHSDFTPSFWQPPKI
ncbi:MAG: DUF6660 family protein [Flavobacteriales bacterium]